MGHEHRELPEVLQREHNSVFETCEDVSEFRHAPAMQESGLDSILRMQLCTQHDASKTACQLVLTNFLKSSRHSRPKICQG